MRSQVVGSVGRREYKQLFAEIARDILLLLVIHMNQMEMLPTLARLRR